MDLLTQVPFEISMSIKDSFKKGLLVLSINLEL